MDLSKELIKGNLSLIILKLLESHGEMYGYQMSSKIKALSKGVIDIKFGSLYPALHRLKTNGIVEVRESFEGPRKRIYYSLSREGELKTQD